MYCTVLKCSFYRVIIVLHFVPVRYVQGHYFTAFCVSVECTRLYNTAVCVNAVSTVSLYYSLCQRGMYRGIIVRQTVSIRYVQGHYFTSDFSIAAQRGALFYCSL
jgi:hypothetical protein